MGDETKTLYERLGEVPLLDWTGYRARVQVEGSMERERWTAKRKVELLLQLIRGEKKFVEVCREHDLKQSEIEGWMDAFVKASPSDPMP